MVSLCGFFSVQVKAQDVFWQRQVQGYLDGVEMAFYHGGMEFTKPVFADIDGDGDGDLYVGEHDGYLNVFENLGGNPPQWFCVTTALDTIDVGKQNAPAFWDIDLDGDLDLFIGDEDGDIWFFQNDGNAQNPIWTFVDSNYIAPILVNHHAIPFFHDLDADGDDDLLVGHNDGGAAYFKNVGAPGSPLWSYQTDFYQGIDVGDKSSVCVFDVDADSLPDLFMAGVDGQIHYYHNEGPPEDPSYSDAGIIFDVGANGTPTFWDLDGDGDLDLFAGESDGNLNLLTNTGTATNPVWQFTQTNIAYFDAGYYSMPALADIDNDGDLDLFIGRTPGGMMFLENVGAPDSAAWGLISMSYEHVNLPGQEAAAFWDLDNDGDLDMVVGCSADSLDGTLTYYRNIGTPEAPIWANPVYYYTGVDVGGNSAPVFADVDADSDADLFIGSYAGTLRYLRNDGSPEEPVWTDLGDYPLIDVGSFSTPAFADLDADGDLDLIIGSGGLTGTIAFYRNIGTPAYPSWTLETYYYQNWDFGDHSSPCCGDLDADGDPDLLIGCESGGLYLMNNVGLILDLDITLLPYNPPITIPPEGGSFQYILQLENNERDPQWADVWMTITMPGGDTVGPVDSLSATFQPGLFNQLMTQVISDTFPAGEYAFNGYAGLYPDLIYDSDSFTFEKGEIAAVGDSGSGKYGADLTFSLERPHPNPFNSSVRLMYSVPAASRVEILVFDIAGRKVAVLQDGDQEAGRYEITFTPRNISAGIYFIYMKAGYWKTVRKLCFVP